MGRQVANGFFISYEGVAEVVNYLPNPFGTFEKAEYRICGYSSELFYSCVTTCRSEESMLQYLKERSKNICYMREHHFVRIVKVQEGKEKELFKGNIFK